MGWLLPCRPVYCFKLTTMLKNLLLALSLISTAASAQNVDLVKQTGTSGASIMSSSTVMDRAGNYITRGSFNGTVDFDPGPGIFNLTASGLSDAFVQKLDARGNFLWAVRVGGTGRDRALAVTTDATNNIYILGQFIGTVDMNPGTGVSNLVSSTASVENCFILRLTSAGVFSYARREVPILGTDNMINDQASIDLDNSGWLYTCHSYNTKFYQHISRYSAAAGGLSWQRQIKGNAAVNADRINNTAMQVDATGNVYLAGTFEGTVDLNPSATFNGFTASGFRNAFVVKLNNLGNYLWSQRLSSDYMVGINAIALDNSNNILLAGNYTGTADFDPGAATVSEISDPTGNWAQSMFLLQLNNSGAYGWVKAYQSQSTMDMTGVGVSSTGAIMVAGTFAGNPDFNPKGFYPALLQSYNGSMDIFVSKLSATGDLVWLKHVGGNNDEVTTELYAGSVGEAVLSGIFNGSVTIDAGLSGGATTITPGGFSDAYIVNIGACGSLNNKISKNGKEIIAQEANGNTYTWIDCKTNSPVIDGNKQAYTPTRNGSYAVIITQAQCTVTSECIVIEELSVNDKLSSATIKVYPNPTTGLLQLDLGKEYAKVDIEIRSAVGQLIASQQHNTAQYISANIEGPAGIYLIHIKAGDEQTQLRIIKQ